MATTAADDDRSPRKPSSLLELFRVFSRLALQGFGGVIPIAHVELVERERWLSPEEFVELLAIGQVLPGPNIINVAVIFGDRWFGWRGALAAVAGLLTFPLAIVLSLAFVYQSFASLPLVTGALRGMGVVAAGLIVSTAIKLLKTFSGNPLGLPLSLALALAILVLVGFLRWPLIWAVLGLGIPAIAFAWKRLEAKRREARQ
ncbi:MAG TPA: chromate transporter [Rectinemataceae bacterium]|nr:chromate transporter [Rectinemataceae bacterium]